ncbi:connective tissue growth factor [Lingula anatina]|uniref:Connective tissue growth factor n=1 Tax=Lingula anatina TaxID=7574 RepID=A0A1S3J0Z0_LINAN|nr:connective tissue growth factor [Lingula anatina]|eukprot:XP_013403928.1 connective tissue growth factor [Lingula anatina]
MLLFTVTVLLFTVPRESVGDAHAPCYKCDLVKMEQRHEAKLRSSRSKYTDVCRGPCQCTEQSITCQEGVGGVKDGCNCCFICARQQGETCNKRDICDEAKGLTCDTTFGDGTNGRGICRAKEAKSCEVDGKVHEDGSQWYKDCRTMCTCQNGNYGCVSVCPQEQTKPTNPNCQLVTVRGKCCREWMCHVPRARIRQPPPTKSDYQNTEEIVREPSSPPNRKCNLMTSSWSACSKTCGYGISVRESNDNAECKTVQQQRICIFRTCDLPDKKLRGKTCKATFKAEKSAKLTYKNCTTTRAYRPRYCASCKRHRNCIPVKDKTVTLEFECEKGRLTTLSYMWIKKCKCLHSNPLLARKGWKKKLRKDKKRKKTRLMTDINETA